MAGSPSLLSVSFPFVPRSRFLMMQPLLLHSISSPLCFLRELVSGTPCSHRATVTVSLGLVGTLDGVPYGDGNWREGEVLLLQKALSERWSLSMQLWQNPRQMGAVPMRFVQSLVFAQISCSDCVPANFDRQYRAEGVAAVGDTASEAVNNGIIFSSTVGHPESAMVDLQFGALDVGIRLYNRAQSGMVTRGQIAELRRSLETPLHLNNGHAIGGSWRPVGFVNDTLSRVVAIDGAAPWWRTGCQQGRGAHVSHCGANCCGLARLLL